MAVRLKDLIGEVVVLCLMRLGQFDIYTSRCADELFQRGENRYEVFPIRLSVGSMDTRTSTSKLRSFARKFSEVLP